MSDDHTGQFTVRIGPEYYQVLKGLAKLKQTTVAELGRNYILEGIMGDVDEESIIRKVEEYKARLLAAVKELREPLDEMSSRERKSSTGNGSCDYRNSNTLTHYTE